MLKYFVHSVCLAASCPEGWQRFEGSCYQFTVEPALQWTDAEAQCVSQGGHLVSITSQAEQDFIYGGFPLW